MQSCSHQHFSLTNIFVVMYSCSFGCPTSPAAKSNYWVAKLGHVDKPQVFGVLSNDHVLNISPSKCIKGNLIRYVLSICDPTFPIELFLDFDCRISKFYVHDLLQNEVVRRYHLSITCLQVHNYVFRTNGFTKVKVSQNNRS